jgi:hypothetical protein
MKSIFNQLIAKILNREASPEEVISFNLWLSESEDNQNEFYMLKSYWDAEISFIHNIKPEISFDKTLKKKCSEPPSGKSIGKIIWGLSIAASFLLFTGAGFLLTDKTL